MQSDPSNSVESNPKSPYSKPVLVDHGSVRELTQDVSVLGAIVAVAVSAVAVIV
jgi:hypothetical protein